MNAMAWSRSLTAMVASLVPLAHSGAEIEEPIRLSEDGLHFVIGTSGKKFTPWGFNYVGEFGTVLEETWADDWGAVVEDFRTMRELGANVVRIHLQLGTYMETPTSVRAAEITRLRKLLDLAAESGLYLDLTGLGCYHLEHVPPWLDGLGESARWDVQARFWEAIAEACHGHPAVFCYCLMNEPVIGKPNEGDHPWLGKPLEGFHFVQRISIDPDGRTRGAIAKAWVTRLTDSIRARDPETLITVGVIPWALTFPGAKPVFYQPDVAEALDFVSVHIYPPAGRVDDALAVLESFDIGKPVVIEETFPLACSMEEFAEFLERSKAVADGWISHYFGHSVAAHRDGAQPGGAITAGFLEFWRDNSPGEKKDG
ncbi:cellulase family glycosylhydrolase [soil metagenome]